MDRALVETFAPGDYLTEELDARGWSQSDFAKILGRPIQFVSEIVAGKKEITRGSAAQIGAALGTSAELWLNLQNAYLLSKHHNNDSTKLQLEMVRRRARLNELAPISLLRKRGLLRGDTLDEVEADLMDLLQIPSLDTEPVFVLAARRVDSQVPLTTTQRAWVAVSLRRARALRAKTYDEAGLKRLAETLAKRLVSSRDFEELPELLAGVGVRLVYVEAFPGSKMTGATFLLDQEPTKPVVALSGRGKRLDIVLFTLLHELAHLIHGDVKPGAFRVDEEDAHTAGDEAKANEQAAIWIIPGGLSVPPSPVRQPWVDSEAARLGVSPIVVVGQLQRRKDLDWRTQLVKGAPTVADALATWN